MHCSTLCEVAWREIRWNDDSEAHIARHHIVPGEVEELVNSRPRLAKPGRDGTELLFGTTNAGRHLLVVLTGSEDGCSYVVTAREMTGRERRVFTDRTR